MRTPTAWAALGLTVAGVALAAQDRVARISQDDFKKLFASQRVVVVDTRSHQEFQACHIRGAIELPPYGRLGDPSEAFVKAAAKLRGSKKPVVTYCACPREEEAVLVAALLSDQKVQDVRALTGGWAEWFNGGNPVICRER